jgi:hypothetical protein
MAMILSLSNRAIAWYLLFLFIPVISYDNLHFYRPPRLYPLCEPRIANNWLSTLFLSFSGGATRHGRNNLEKKYLCKELPHMDIWGKHNMHQLIAGVPTKDIIHSIDDIIMTELSLEPARCNFAQFSIESKFHIIELNIDFYQNFINGFFIEAHLPMRNLRVDCPEFIDLSPKNNIRPNIKTLEWQRFLNSFDNILKKYCFEKSYEKFNETNIGDLSILLGYAINYYETEILDYIDATIKLGVLFPTSPERDLTNIFALPLGYEGHWGFPVIFDFAIGAYEWLTFGSHMQATIFADHSRDMRLKTGGAQSGIIKLARGCVKENRGLLWHTSAYFKADHVVRGMSFFFGYSFAKQTRRNLTVQTPSIDTCIANTDRELDGWKMHTLHYLFEFDFSGETSKACPRVALFIDQHVGGKNVFKTTMFGGTFGIDFTLKF